MKKFLMPALAMAVALTAGSVAAKADVLDKVKEKGVLVVGVKTDYKPFGFRSPDGSIIGIEPELAADVAKRLKVKLELVPVISSNRMEFLKQGKIDLMIATMSDKPERREQVQFIEPLYYSDAVNILMSKKVKVTAWKQLKDAPICGSTGTFYNKPVESEYGAKIVAFDGTEKPLAALKQGNCVGFLYDQSLVQAKLTEPEWSADYAMPLPSIMETPWAMAVAKGEDRFAKFMSDVTKDWMKSGAIVALEKKYGIAPTAYSQRMHAQFK